MDTEREEGGRKRWEGGAKEGLRELGSLREVGRQRRKGGIDGGRKGELTDLKSVDGKSHKPGEFGEVVGAAWRGAHLVRGWDDEEEGDVFVQFYDLMAIQLMLLSILV